VTATREVPFFTLTVVGDAAAVTVETAFATVTSTVELDGRFCSSPR